MTVQRVAFVCVGNAGRSQMATAFAERERDERGMEVEIVTGGVDPAERVHDEVVTALRERDVDIGDRIPRRITPADVENATHVVTMGCSVDQFRPADWDGESREWTLDHPGGEGLDAFRDQRDEIERRVREFFDEIE